MKKQIVILLIMIILSTAVTVGLILLNSGAIESNAYISYDISDNKEKVVSRIYEIDEILLQNGNELDMETKVELISSYILNNFDKYQSQIVQLEQRFVYEQDEETYYTNYYVDINLIKRLVKEFFTLNDFDLKQSKYYDNNSGFIALISRSVDGIKIDSKECTMIERINDKGCKVKIQYVIDEENRISFEVIYDLEILEDKYLIKNFSVSK